VEHKPDGHPPDGFVVVKWVVKEDPVVDGWFVIKRCERFFFLFKQIYARLDLNCCEKRRALIKVSVKPTRRENMTHRVSILCVEFR
jgi:hypothetical protein